MYGTITSDSYNIDITTASSSVVTPNNDEERAKTVLLCVNHFFNKHKQTYFPYDSRMDQYDFSAYQLTTEGYKNFYRSQQFTSKDWNNLLDVIDNNNFFAEVPVSFNTGKDGSSNLLAQWNMIKLDVTSASSVITSNVIAISARNFSGSVPMMSITDEGTEAIRSVRNAQYDIENPRKINANPLYCVGMTCVIYCVCCVVLPILAVTVVVLVNLKNYPAPQARA